MTGGESNGVHCATRRHPAAPGATLSRTEMPEGGCGNGRDLGNSLWRSRSNNQVARRYGDRYKLRRLIMTGINYSIRARGPFPRRDAAFGDARSRKESQFRLISLADSPFANERRSAVVDGSESKTYRKWWRMKRRQFCLSFGWNFPPISRFVNLYLARCDDRWLRRYEESSRERVRPLGLTLCLD